MNAGHRTHRSLRALCVAYARATQLERERWISSAELEPAPPCPCCGRPFCDGCDQDLGDLGAKDNDVEEVYQNVLHAIATEAQG